MTYDPRGNLKTVNGPLPSADVWAYKYDAADQLTGVISPDPDGGGSLPNRAVRISYRPDGQVEKQEFGTTSGQGDFAFANMEVSQRVETAYDSNSRPNMVRMFSAFARLAQSQFSYDALGRLDCTAVRMDRAEFGADAGLSACTLGANTDPPDRITKLIYDAANQVVENRVAVGTAAAATERTLTYTDNGLLKTLKDAENNLTTYEYDGHDRLSKTRYPLVTKGANASSLTLVDQPTYDPNGNVVSFRNRGGQVINFTYDDLDRVTLKDLPAAEPDVSYAYDNFGRLTSVSESGHALSFTYDALSRNLTQTGPNGTSTYAYDSAGRRISMTYPAGGTALTIAYDYLTTGDLAAIRQGAGSLAAYTYDDLGNRTQTTFANGVFQAYLYDGISRLRKVTNNFAGTANDLVKDFTHNPASQIATATLSNDSYAYPKTNVAETGVANGHNELTQYAGRAVDHNARGDLIGFGADSFSYTSEHLMRSATVGGATTSLHYDPLMRLYETVSGGVTSRFAYDGLDAIAEYDGSGALQRRYVFDPTGVTGQPIVWYEGIGTAAADRRYLSADERGSVISVSDGSGGLLTVNRYDEYGIPDFGSLAGQRFGYTGQAWLPSVGIWYYKARMYAPHIGGRFMQPDPIGYWDSPNLYAYVLNDPVNMVDPLGLQDEDPDLGEDIIVIGCRSGGIFVGDPRHGGICMGFEEFRQYLNWIFAPFDFLIDAIERGGGSAAQQRPVCVGTSGLRTPDFYEFEFNIPIPQLPQFGPGASLTIDRYGQVYGGTSFAFGIPTAAGASLTGGWMTSSRSPTPTQLQSFLTGWSGQGGAGYGVGGFYTSTLTSGSAVSVGLATPGAALKRQYVWQAGNLGISKCPN